MYSLKHLALLLLLCITWISASHKECGESPTIKYRELAKTLGK